MVVYTRIHLVIVSIHTPTQGVTTSIMYPAQASQFQSTHPRRVWLQQQSSVQNSISFNPHTHAGCDLFIISFISERSVSIHTPTQGVTQSITSTKLIKIVSIHTPTQGVTLASYSLFWWYTSFNPHTHAGCDKEIWMRSLRNGLFQSTHPRRVWPSHKWQDPRHTSFNPHTHAGCDKEIWMRSLRNGLFQSTHPRRVWPRMDT